MTKTSKILTGIAILGLCVCVYLIINKPDTPNEQPVTKTDTTVLTVIAKDSANLCRWFDGVRITQSFGNDAGGVFEPDSTNSTYYLKLNPASEKLYKVHESYIISETTKNR